MRFSYDAGGNVVSVDYSDDYGDTFTTYYYLRNAQGDIVKMIDSSGNTVVEYVYDSWGKPISRTGSLAGSLGRDQPFRYRGYVYDEETGWYYLQSRYYDPTTCRFISADVLLSTGQGVIGHNAFAYCNNDPDNMFDDGGDAPWYLIWNNWGYIHRKVQKDIEKRYGYYINRPCTTGIIDVIDSGCNIWEVKSCGPAALGANAQLERYMNADEHFEKGVTITQHYFEDVAPNGDRIWIMYWQAEPGVVLYAWGKTIDEMLKDARKAGVAASVIVTLFGAKKYLSIIKGIGGGILGGGVRGGFVGAHAKGLIDNRAM